MLEAARIPFLAVDQDLDRLRLARRLGHEVRYADLSDPALLTTLDVDRARAVIVAVPEFPIGRRLVDALKRFHPRVPALVSVQTLGQQESMRQLGAEHVVALSLEGTLRFSRLVLTSLGVEQHTTDSDPLHDGGGRLRRDADRRVLGSDGLGRRPAVGELSPEALP